MTSLTQMVQLRLAGMTGSPRQFATARLAAMLGRSDLPSRSELAALRPATRVLILGLAACIGLVGVVTISALISLELSTFTAPAWLGRAGAAAKPSNARAGGFENILQRPLFSRNRQGFVAAEPVAAPPPMAPLDSGLSLKGVFISDGIAKAFLISAQSPLGVWVEVNGQIDGWRVAAVTPEHVVLEGQGEKLTVPLHASGR
ncbi:hypothetical protein [Bradyrhizobium sp. CB3481]|uniref:hypothetical protein n=1 Tax=Bradyrhizobium sp. CB3481 TaxID=3039158 RepID=UPI0024B0A28F|nr:hypothetical protein [Bradyrhizobium sp. CB3481]WFU18765.1 hypothetical protein QA643_10735 [Bradyrhizobium sp. CB3481]